MMHNSYLTDMAYRTRCEDALREARGQYLADLATGARSPGASLASRLMAGLRGAVNGRRHPAATPDYRVRPRTA